MTGKPAHDPDRPQYPEHREAFGLDPARFLYAEMDVRPLLRGIRRRPTPSVPERRADRDEPDRELIGDIAERIEALKSVESPDATPSASSREVATDGGVER